MRSVFTVRTVPTPAHHNRTINQPSFCVRATGGRNSQQGGEERLSKEDSLLVERLRENLADFNEKLYKNLYQDRLDGPIKGHVLVQISRFLKSFSAKSAQFSCNRSTSFYA